MHLSISHTTHYAFSDPVAYGVQRLRLKPKSTHGQLVNGWTMELDGAVAQVEYEDEYNNPTALVSVLPGTRELTIRCHGEVETVDNAGVLGAHTGLVPLWCFQRQTALTQPGPRLSAIVASLDADRGNTLELLHALSRVVQETVAYEPGTTDARTTAEEALLAGKGVCQDHAHIFTGAARMLGVPARYVGGYLKLDGRDEQEAGHAWAEAHVAGLGWVGFDVSNAICPDDRYVRVASGCDYASAAPITGLSHGIGSTALAVAVVVEQSQSAQAQQQRMGAMGQQQNFGE